MNAPFRALDFFAHPLVVKHFGAKRRFYPGETTLADLGARIVAGALADVFDAAWDHAIATAKPNMTKPLAPWLLDLSDAHQALAQMAVGDDDETASSEAETIERFDRAFASYRRPGR